MEEKRHKCRQTKSHPSARKIPPIHEHNKKTPPRFSSDKIVIQYLHFFCNYVWGEDGAFRIIASAKELDNIEFDNKEFTPIEREAYLQNQIEKIYNDKKEIRYYELKAIVTYSGNLFKTIFRVEPSGMVEMIDDTPIGQVKNEFFHYSAPFRQTLPLWPKIKYFTNNWDTIKQFKKNEINEVFLKTLDKLNVDLHLVRNCTLPFYEGWKIYQGFGARQSGEWVIISWLSKGDRAILLDGTSRPIHELNGDTKPELTSDETALAYLRFFCSYVWGEYEGKSHAFIIVENTDDLPVDTKVVQKFEKFMIPIKITRKTEDNKEVIDINTLVFFLGNLFSATFNISPDGSVKMSDDDPLTGGAQTNSLLEFKEGLIYPDPRALKTNTQYTSTFPGKWRKLSSREKSIFIDSNNEKIASLPAAQINLMAVETSFLADDEAKAWGEKTQPNFSGFTYRYILKENKIEAERPYAESFKDASDVENEQTKDKVKIIESSEAGDAKARLKWLSSQYSESKPANLSEFDPQPYQHLAQFYRRTGRINDALDIIEYQTTLEQELRENAGIKRWWKKIAIFALVISLGLMFFGLPILTAIIAGITTWFGITFARKVGRKLFQIFFRYGLSWIRALSTICLFLAIGWLGVEASNKGEIRIPNLLGGGKPIILYSFREYPQALVVDSLADSSGTTTSSKSLSPKNVEIACGNNIQPFLYALDVFIPLIDLKQEIRCRPSNKSWANSWHWLKAFYKILGWLVSSLAILTFAGIMKRKSDG